jgi:Tfp pilus assembly protein PilZ
MEKVAPSLSAEALPPDPVLRKIRIPFIQRASVSVGGRREDLFMVDLGLRGTFLERMEAMAPGEEIEIWFTLPGNEIPVHARGRVAWWRPPGDPRRALGMPPGVGVEFVEMSERDGERVRQHLAEYLRQDPRHRRFLRHPEESEEEGA